jgi:hypothetical protein
MTARFPITETFAYLVNIYRMPGDNFFHPDFRGWNKVEGGVFFFASGRVNALSLEYFKTGLRD